MADVKHMGVREFVEQGYLQEVNRCVLHPAGLALEATTFEKPVTLVALTEKHRHLLRTFAVGLPAALGEGLLEALDAPIAAGEEVLSGVWDCREDPEGIGFAPQIMAAAAEKVARVTAEYERHRQARQKLFEQQPGRVGQPVIQPLPAP